MSGGSNSIHSDQLRLLLERVERIDEDIAGMQDDRKDVLAEAKSAGFDMPTFREMLKLRKLERDALREKEALRDTYMVATGLANLLD